MRSEREGGNRDGLAVASAAAAVRSTFYVLIITLDIGHLLSYIF